MNHTSKLPQVGEIILASCPNFGHVIDFTGGQPRSVVAVPYNGNLIEQKPHSDEYQIKSLAVYDIDGERGRGCENCLGMGQIAEYQRRDTDPYYRLRACPDCSEEE